MLLLGKWEGLGLKQILLWSPQKGSNPLMTSPLPPLSSSSSSPPPPSPPSTAASVFKVMSHIVA